MSLQSPVAFASISDAEFDEIDRLVMGCSFASQNDLGRLCDERVYENDVAERLRSEGCPGVQTQVPVTLMHRDFTKTYRLDLVVRQMVYEFKTAKALAPAHDAQAIHYAALLGIDRVKLINFRSPRVVGRLLRSPSLARTDSRLAVCTNRWHALSEHCGALLASMAGLLRDVGAFLESRLYEEALVHFSGGEGKCVQRLPLVRISRLLGTHRFNCHSTRSAFVVTSFSEEATAHEQQLRRLLRFTDLKGIQWFNLNRSELQAVTLEQDGPGGADE